MKDYFILVINPGSTSTKCAVYRNESEIASYSESHSYEELKPFNRIIDQFDFRMHVLDKFIEKSDIDSTSLNAVVGRGGLLHPIPSGTYIVNEAMLIDLKTGLFGEHASNLGGLMAHSWASRMGIPAYIVDPVVVDEMQDIARYTGIPEIKRRSIFHALNQKSAAKAVARKMGRSYQNLQLIVVHLGGGISVGAHKNGRVIDVNNALDGDGPFSPERAGSIPAGQLVDLCFSQGADLSNLKKKLTGKGGLTAYLGTNDLRIVSHQIQDGYKEAERVFEAMIYQIVKSIGEMSAVLQGKVDAVILTGGMVYNADLVEKIKSYISWIGDIHVLPGENEMLALAQGCLRILNGEEELMHYQQENIP